MRLVVVKIDDGERTKEALERVAGNGIGYQELSSEETRDIDEAVYLAAEWAPDTVEEEISDYFGKIGKARKALWKLKGHKSESTTG